MEDSVVRVHLRLCQKFPVDFRPMREACAWVDDIDLGKSINRYYAGISIIDFIVATSFNDGYRCDFSETSCNCETSDSASDDCVVLAPKESSCRFAKRTDIVECRISRGCYLISPQSYRSSRT